LGVVKFVGLLAENLTKIINMLLVENGYFKPNYSASLLCAEPTNVTAQCSHSVDVAFE